MVDLHFKPDQEDEVVVEVMVKVVDFLEDLVLNFNDLNLDDICYLLLICVF